jgi:hypothetical protein
MYESVEEGPAIAVRQHQGLMTLECSARCFRQRHQTEIGEGAALKAHGTLQQVLGLGIDAKTKTRIAVA